LLGQDYVTAFCDASYNFFQAADKLDRPLPENWRMLLQRDAQRFEKSIQDVEKWRADVANKLVAKRRELTGRWHNLAF